MDDVGYDPANHPRKCVKLMLEDDVSFHLGRFSRFGVEHLLALSPVFSDVLPRHMFFFFLPSRVDLFGSITPCDFLNGISKLDGCH